MSGFSADWLARREAHDHAARSRPLIAALASWAAARQGPIQALDLGSGTGSTVRALAGAVPAIEAWTLVEHDPALIERGRAALVADPATAALRCGYREVDLARGIPDALLDGVQLVTASALIDLVSAGWLERLVDQVRTRRIALYVALSYDGRLSWSPADRDDPIMQALFDRHQHSDKGFGPALGPDAAALLEDRLASLPGRTIAAASDWQLRPEDQPLQAAMVEGIAAAARAIEPGAAQLIEAWAERRLGLITAGAARLCVGHRDVLHLPSAIRQA